MKNFSLLLNENLDILKEIGSIGMGHASTSLAQMLNMKVTMTIPSIHVMTPEEALEYLKRHDDSSLGVKLGLQGTAKGVIIQILTKKFAMHIINYFFQNNLEELGDLDEMSLSVIQEIGNITSGAYCNSLASMTGLLIDISTPTHCKDICKDSGIADRKSDALIIINNSFFIGDEEVKSDFLFMPEEETIEMVLTKLKEYYGLVG